MEAEYHAVHMGSLNVLWIRQLFKQINIPFTTPLPLYCNNQAVIATVKAKQAHQHSKHINIKFHLIHEHIEWGQIMLDAVQSKKNLADVFTKSLLYNSHNESVQGLGLGFVPVDDDVSISQYLSLNSEGDSWNEREC